MNLSQMALGMAPILLLLGLGCDSSDPKTTKGEGWIQSEGAITVKDGEISKGRPAVTEEVEREIYKSLNHRRKMIAAIEKGSGSTQAIQQMQDELSLLTRGFMSRYDLTRAQIDEILTKGESNAWD